MNMSQFIVLENFHHKLPNTLPMLKEKKKNKFYALRT